MTIVFCCYIARRIVISLESNDEIARSAFDRFKNFTPINWLFSIRWLHSCSI